MSLLLQNDKDSKIEELRGKIEDRDIKLVRKSNLIWKIFKRFSDTGKRKHLKKIRYEGVILTNLALLFLFNIEKVV